ncbi:hypothetical protein SCALM49S_09516 [Streptomyces californicus]
MIRRIAITLAAVTAAGFIAAAPASANGLDAHAGGHAGIEAGWAIGEYQNRRPVRDHHREGAGSLLRRGARLDRSLTPPPGVHNRRRAPGWE